uniref:Uncharacterized protein n=1 Tax=Nelumbo nucifera TaxID=4432 RepID=A0A822Z2K6_NELNU|nr:TPA_asm: hypothetical protein HUJ06_008331 [Nelumbo nucifera]
MEEYCLALCKEYPCSSFWTLAIIRLCHALHVIHKSLASLLLNSL